MSNQLQLLGRMTVALCLSSCLSVVFAQEEEPPSLATAPQQQEEGSPAAEAPRAMGGQEPTPSFQSDAEIVRRPEATRTGGATHSGESAGLRDPFWPIGFSPVVPGIPKKTNAVQAQVVRVEEPPKWDEALKSLKVEGVMKTAKGDYIAVVNGQVASEQEVISKSFDGKTYSWRISSISKAGIKFVRESVSH